MTLSLVNISFERHYQTLFSDVQSELQSGECLQITGENGSGKSTLLRIISGLLQPHQGDVLWNGESIVRDKELYVSHINYLGHHNGIKANLTVAENLKLIDAVCDKQLAWHDVLQKLSLTRVAHRLVSTLSAGQLRRLALARALFHPANIWILDEPLTALDAEGQLFFMECLRQYLDAGGIAVIATHQLLQGIERLKTIHLAPPHPTREKRVSTSPTRGEVKNNSLPLPLWERSPREARRVRGNTTYSFISLIYYEILSYLREPTAWLTPLLFFTILVCLFPLALGTDNNLLSTIAPVIIWIGALLSILISLNHLFHPDARDGHLDLLLLSPRSLTGMVLTKTFSYWVVHVVPLIAISPLLGFLLNLPALQQMTLIITLALGTPVLVLIGALGAALTVGIRHQGLLLPILIMPLYIPVLIFSSSALMAAHFQQPIQANIAILGALLLVTLGFAPLLTSAALRSGANQ